MVGSNGKGSTAAMTRAILSAHGLRTGLFTSPHLFHPRERLMLDGTPIDDGSLERLAARVMDFARRCTARGLGRVGSFEATFMVALAWWQEVAPDAIVWEAGLGGRYDPTRSIDARIGILTALDLEHTGLLGTTLEEIAYNKIDGVGRGGRIVLGPGIPGAVLSAACDYATHAAGLSVSRIAGHAEPSRDSDRFSPSPAARLSQIAITRAGTTFLLEDGGSGQTPYRVGLIGTHQADNAARALVATRAFLSQPREDAPAPLLLWSVAAARAGLEAARWPGRLERINTAPNIWIDVGHTPDAMARTLATLAEMASLERATLVLGASADKNTGEIVTTLAPHFARVIATAAHHKGAAAEDIAALARKARAREARIGGATAAAGHGDGDATTVRVAATVGDAADIVRRSCGPGDTVAVLGGLFLAAEFKCAWAGGDPAALRFL